MACWFLAKILLLRTHHLWNSTTELILVLSFLAAYKFNWRQTSCGVLRSASVFREFLIHRVTYKIDLNLSMKMTIERYHFRRTLLFHAALRLSIWSKLDITFNDISHPTLHKKIRVNPRFEFKAGDSNLCLVHVIFGAHSRYYKRALTQERYFLVLCTTFRYDFHVGWKNQNKHSTLNMSFDAL